jgi:putative transposase
VPGIGFERGKAMPRRKVEFVRGEIYHLYNRGAGKLQIFIFPEHFYLFTTKCWSYSKSLDIPIIAFCLMPNHFHLLVMQGGDISAGKLPQRVCNSYSKTFNKQMNRTGTLFEGRYRAKHVENQEYLEQLCAYIHLNPTTAGIIAKPEHWPYSDYHRWIEKDLARNQMKIHHDLGLKAGKDYRRFVDSFRSGRE